MKKQLLKFYAVLLENELKKPEGEQDKEKINGYKLRIAELAANLLEEQIKSEENSDEESKSPIKTIVKEPPDDPQSKEWAMVQASILAQGFADDKIALMPGSFAGHKGVFIGVETNKGEALAVLGFLINHPAYTNLVKPMDASIVSSGKISVGSGGLKIEDSILDAFKDGKAIPVQNKHAKDLN